MGMLVENTYVNTEVRTTGEGSCKNQKDIQVNQKRLVVAA